MAHFTALMRGIVIFAVTYLLYRIKIAFDPDLRKIPGPFLHRFTNWPLKTQVLTGNQTPYIHNLHKIYGPIVRIGPNEVAIVDITAYQQIHKIGTHFVKSPWYQNQVPSQYDDETCGVFGVRDNRKAAQRRKLYQQVGTKAAVRTWEPRFVEIIDLAVEKIKRDAKVNGKVDVFKWIAMMTTDVLGELAFGEPFRMVETEEKPQLVKDIELSMVAVGIRLELPILWHILYRLPIPAIQHFMQDNDRVMQAGDRAVQNTKKAVIGHGQTIFSKMYPEDDAPLFPDSLMAQEAGNLIIAGSDTTAVALTHFIYSVLANPDIKTKLLRELDEAQLTWDNLEGLEYLNNVIQETLRLYPSVPGSLPRTCPDGGAVLAEYKIPAKVTVSTQAYTFHRDPLVFKEPERFNPDCWKNPTVEMKQHFMPFGGSARSCLGQNIGRLELLHSAARFFTQCPGAELAESVTPESMSIVDFFVAKPKGGVVEIVIS